MAHAFQQTSLIDILSSTHGRMRREKRDINKRDLQKALKYGTRERTWGQRWKFEYDGIVYIADNSLTREVTAYPSPLAMAPLTPQQLDEHEKARLLLEKKPELCVSHTVFVIDNSGSMMTHDIPLHRDRQTAAYTSTALEFVAEQLFNNTANNSDAISLIEFQRSASCVFNRQSVSWMSFNKLLGRRDSRNFCSRQSDPFLDTFHGKSMYIPALDLAFATLKDKDHEDCALCLYFLTGGAPSDGKDLGLTPQGTYSHISTKLTQIAAAFGERLTINLVGFGGVSKDFDCLLSMKEAVKMAATGCIVDFIYCDKMSRSMGIAISSMVTSLTSTKTRLQAGPSGKYTERPFLCAESEFFNNKNQFRRHRLILINNWDPRTRHFHILYLLPAKAIRSASSKSSIQDCLTKNQFSAVVDAYLNINELFLGKGAGRVAYRCYLSYQDGSQLDTMVAKEPKHMEHVSQHINFHRVFLETQSLASFLATEFNSRVKALPGQHCTVEFVACAIFVVEDWNWPNGERGVLVEEKLETDRFPWTKWNDNAGCVDGRRAHVPLDVDYELRQLDRSMLPHIADCDEEESDEEEIEAQPCDCCAPPLFRATTPSVRNRRTIFKLSLISPTCTLERSFWCVTCKVCLIVKLAFFD